MTQTKTFTMGAAARMRTQLHAIRNRKPTRRLQLFCGLPGGFRVHSDFLGLIKRSVREVMPFLWHGNEYATEKLLGTKFWCALNGAEARMAELCLAEMVGRGEVALRVTSRDHDGAVRYTVA